MDAITCPQCGTEMTRRPHGAAQIHECPDGHGVFLSRADVGALVEAETDWHRNAGAHTAPIPRITSDMPAPRATARAARAWVETLFS